MKAASWLCLQQFPGASNLPQDERLSQRPMAGSPVARQRPFGLGTGPIRQGRDSLRLSASGMRFLPPPVAAME
jgi:hypothetical protein